MRRGISFATLGIFSACVVLAGCGGNSGAGKQGSGGTLSKIRSSGILRVAAPVAEPFVIQKPNGTYVGLDIDLMKRLGKRLNVKVQFVPASFQNAEAGLSADKWEVIPALCITSERKKVVDYTQTTVTVQEAWAVRAGEPYQSLKDLNSPSVRIPVSSGAVSEQVTKEYMPKANIVSIPGLNPARSLQELLSGRADAISLEKPFYTSLYKKQYPGKLRFIPGGDKGVESCPVAWAVGKNEHPWRQYLNNFLSSVKKNGTLSKLVDKWSAKFAREKSD